MLSSGSAPPAVRLNPTSLIRIVSLHCSALAQRESAANNQDPCSCSWVPIRPCFLLLASTTMPTWTKPLLLCTCIPPVQYPAAASTAEWVLKGRVGSHRTACWQPGPLHPQVALELATCPAPSLHVCLQPVPVTTQHLRPSVYTSSGHQFCLSWFLATCPGRAAEDTTSACNHCSLPTLLAKNHAVVGAMDPNSLRWRDITSPHTWCHPAAPDLWSEPCPYLPTPSVERLPLLKSLQKVWKR